MKKAVLFSSMTNILVFSIVLYLIWGVSGGDLFLLLVWSLFSALQTIIVVIIFFNRGKLLAGAIIGILVSIIIGIGVLKFIGYQRNKTSAHIEVGKS